MWSNPDFIPETNEMLNFINSLRIGTIKACAAFLVVLVGVVVLASSVFTVQETSRISSRWDEFSRGPALKYVHLNRLRRSIGYGGAVHNLKNYLLRGNRSRIILIHNKLREGITHTIAYRSLGVSSREAAALDVIGRVFKTYSGVVGIAEKMFIAGKSAREIDNAVKVDDTLALRAIENLESELEAARAKLSNAVNASVASTMDFEIKSAVVIAVLLLLLIIDGLWFTRTRISRPITRLAWAMDRLAAGDTSTEIPQVRQDNEIGDIAKSVQVFKENAIKRAEAERALQQSEERFRNLVDYAGDAIFVNDFEGNIVDVNQYACESLGYPRGELLSLKVRDIEVGPDLSEHLKKLRAMDIGDIFTVEGIHQRKDKSTYPVEVRLGKFELRGEEFIVALTRDMTARKEAESKILIAKGEAEAASRAKSEFLSNMSHELRSPLNSVVGFSDLLIRDSSDEFTQRLAPKIRDSGLYLTNLIEDLLDFDRIESGKVNLEQKEISVNDLVTHIAETGAPQISDNISLVLDLNPACRKVFCDPVRIRQVLTNLLDNAVKYSPGGGEIRIRTAANQDEVLVSVSDTGIGMNSAEMHGIFERFNQLESGYQRRSGGLGIGLSLIRELVELHGGRIWAESEKERGSEFTFSLPWVSPAPKSSDGPETLARLRAAQKNPWDGRSVLVVDDLEHYHEYMRLLMSSASPLRSAYNGKEAIDLARRERPALILMDLRMPVMDGFDAIENLKTDPLTKEIPILAVTAQVMAQDRSRSIELGADGFVTKPINIESFQSEINRVIS
jgi:PAS domain S-box-containing protein